jgi:hypothetical protein
VESKKILQDHLWKNIILATLADYSDLLLFSLQGLSGLALKTRILKNEKSVCPNDNTKSIIANG